MMILERTERRLIVLMSGLALLLSSSQTARAAVEPPVTTASVLAEHCAQVAQLTVSHRAITPETLRQSIILLKAAMRLDPKEPRFARLLGEAALQARDSQSALEAYKALKDLDSNDRFAQIRFIDLSMAELQTSQKRLEYLQKVMQHDKIAAEVRSHAAFLACNIHFERAETTEAIKMLEEALRLNPLSPEALKLKYDLGGTTAAPRERVELLLTMLKSNPAQPGVMTQVGAELAEMGLHDQAIDWYNNGFNWAGAVGRPSAGRDYVGYTAQAIVVDQGSAAAAMLEKMLEADPTNVDAAFLALIPARRSGDADRLKKAQDAAENALIQRALAVRNVLEENKAKAAGGDAGPATQPAAVQIDVGSDLRLLAEANNPQLTTLYASILTDLAWLRVYFSDNAAAAEQILIPLRQLLPPDSVTIARLEGWVFLLGGRPDEAKVKLSAVSDRDPLAQLGMIRIMEQDPAQREHATEEAQKLMDENPAGVLGAIIHDALRDKKSRLQPGQAPPLSSEGEAVKALIEAFPREWLDIMAEPTKFYMLRAEPMKVTHHYAEPIIARITLQNVSKYDITVGPDGTIRPDVWFNVQFKGVNPGGFLGVAFDRLGQHVLLKPEERIVQTVRLDQGQLFNVLQSDAALAWPIFFTALTNPLTMQTNIGPGPCGQRVTFNRVVNRVGVPIEDKSIQKAVGELLNGTPVQKIEAAQLLFWFVKRFSQSGDDATKQKAAQLLGGIQKAGNDPDPHVRAMVNDVVGGVLDPASLETFLDNMFRDPAWETRLLGLMLLQRVDPAKWKTIAGPLAESDPDPLVRELASAVVAFADNPASTQPTSQPAAEEGAVPLAQPE